MGRMPRLVERGKKDRRLGAPSGVRWEEIEGLDLDPRRGSGGARRSTARSEGGGGGGIPARAQPGVGEAGGSAASGAGAAGAGPGGRGEARVVRAAPRIGRGG